MCLLLKSTQADCYKLPKAHSKLFAKCKYVSNHGIQKWRAKQIGYMLAIPQYVNNRKRTILEPGDCAALYKYVNSQRVCREGVAALVDGHGDLAATAAQKAEALNSPFSSVSIMDDGHLIFAKAPAIICPT